MKVKASDSTPLLLNVPQCLEITSPIEFILDRVGRKWSLQILRELFRGSRRTYELVEALPGISTKTLTIRLRQLEQYGLVKRTVYPEIPPRVEYSLTEKGQELQPVIEALQQVGQQWLQQQSHVCPLELSG
ncbi:helix-turn-helix domain-containing protein [Lyngbya sp. PCC 8106]|uniref:winged helix-turn-helix transcriptional regulator n=1 Tax=Lyngbya sp. (strain PCC 8106) TaxID=313612 RepID=UPI0000EACE26|nr:helix-turn-helix domain-containing protein [Lyngbya sp. PCC 8106]EAW34787.1 hypothetical protein L8106_26232 [Lyngbya sp. PCC 8106]